MMMSSLSIANELKPPQTITTATIAMRVLSKTLKNSHYRVIGACFWMHHIPPRVDMTPALEQFLPDFVVTVSNQPGANPWKEINGLYENKVALKAYQTTLMKLLGTAFDVADSTHQMNPLHLNESRSRVVSVLGSPASLYALPNLTLTPETHFATPYYSSLADAYSDRTEEGELAYLATHPYLLGHEIGTLTHSWGPEIPRLMQVIQPSRFRASVVAALHAADIVTNQESLHVAHFTTNQCGKHCTIANVVYDPKQENTLWQEVYPQNRLIKPGDPNDFGEADDSKGHGNYIFVIWRKYRGCVQHSGKLVWAYPDAGKPIKR